MYFITAKITLILSLFFIINNNILAEEPLFFPGSQYSGTKIYLEENKPREIKNNFVTLGNIINYDEVSPSVSTEIATSMKLDNHLKRIDTYFIGRQKNLFYRDLELFQNKQRIKNRKNNTFDPTLYIINR